MSNTTPINKTAMPKNLGYSIPLFVPNVLGYIRFITIVASWPFALSDPQTFLALYITSYGLGAIDGPLAKLLNQ